MSRILIRARFGLPPDPWAGVQMDTGDVARAGELIQAASAARMFVSILGPRGSGKTRSAWRALSQPGVQVVAPLRLDRERLHMGDIQAALIRDLSEERPRQSGEARAYQVRRILGAAQQNGAVVLLLDDGHLLHHGTLRALKRLRELGWLGISPLLGIVLIGQRDRVEEVPEVGLRSDSLWFAGLTQAEAQEAISQALNRKRELVEPEAAKALAGSPRARNWLDLQAMADQCLAEAAASGEAKITAEIAGVVMGTRQRQAAQPESAAEVDDAAVTAHLSRGRARKSA